MEETRRECLGAAENDIIPGPAPYATTYPLMSFILGSSLRFFSPAALLRKGRVPRAENLVLTSSGLGG